MSFRKSIRLAAARVLAVLSLLSSGSAAAEEATRPRQIRIVLAGDSTVTDNAGWGGGFAALLRNSECVNLSKGGRSSKSFIADGSWKKALDLKPDYVLIQFGHNDQPGHGDRETDPETTYRQYMNQYVDEARGAGIKPVLVTSLSRRQWGPDGMIHSTLTPYAEVVKQIAFEKKVPLIDLHALSIDFYQKEGREKILEISPIKNADAGSADSDTTAVSRKSIDGTHLNAKGGPIIGAMVAGELKKAVPDLAPLIP
ncbi:MAG: rhamnogalacturonan acetylesterase [Verrucomicrobiota bacterium]